MHIFNFNTLSYITIIIYRFSIGFQVDEYIKIRSAEEGMIHNKKVKQ